MFPLPLVNLEEVTRRLTETQKRVEVLWQEPESLAFVARGREYRSEFHINDSDEFTYMIKGTMNLHYRLPAGGEKVIIINQGSVNFMPAGMLHSPRSPPMLLP
jgi:3-hydroxyanthranilate 3,4-dioxygenase